MAEKKAGKRFLFKEIIWNIFDSFMWTHLQEGVRGGLFSWAVPPLGNPSCEVNTNAGNWEVLQWVTGRDEEPVVLVWLCWWQPALWPARDRLAVWKHLGAWASQASTQGCLDPPVLLPPSKGSVEVSSRSSAEQMGPACSAKVLHRDRLKKDVSFCGSVTQRGRKYLMVPVTGVFWCSCSRQCCPDLSRLSGACLGRACSVEKDLAAL